jgi:hypothetical protein
VKYEYSKRQRILHNYSFSPAKASNPFNLNGYRIKRENFKRKKGQKKRIREQKSVTTTIGNQRQ